MNKYIDCSKLGKIKESEFSELLLSQVGGTIQIPSKYQDMYDHIDIIWKYNNKTFTFDIKSAKKIVELIILQIIISTEWS